MSPLGPAPVGPFSHAVRAGDYLFVTGQMPTSGEGSKNIIEGGIEEQTHQVMENLSQVLKGLDSSLDRTVFSRIYLRNFEDYNAVNKIYESYFNPERLPARTCIGVTGLAVNALVEIDLIVAC
ncbi:MAG: RidA family protein [Desulfobulbia bacterium]